MSDASLTPRAAFLIRKPERKDAPQIAGIQHEARKNLDAQLLSQKQLEAISLVDREKYWEELILLAPRHDITIFLAEADEQIRGFISLRAKRSANAGEIDRLYVAPAHQRQGLGRALFKQGLDHLRDYGFDKVTVWTFDGDEVASAFCQAFGFKPDGAARKNSTFPREYRSVLAIEGW